MPWLRTMTASSLIAGTYAPPAVHEPSTAAICGMPSALIVRLVVEDAAEVLAVGEHLVLPRQERAAGVDQVDARQPVLPRDLLRAQVLLDRDRVVRAALHRRVVGDDHAFAPGHPADAGDHARAGALVVVHAVGGQRREISRNGLPGSSSPSTRSRGSSLPRLTWRSRDLRRAAERGGGQLRAQLRDEREVLLAAGLKRCVVIGVTRSVELMTTNSWYVSHD